MGRVTLPDHENMSTRSPLRVRGTPAQRQVWQEVGAECGMTETAFARASLLILLKAISQHEPGILARAVKRANRSLLEQGFPPVTSTTARCVAVNCNPVTMTAPLSARLAPTPSRR